MPTVFKRLILTCLLFASIFMAHAQITIQGKAMDQSDSLALFGANIMLYTQNDSLPRYYTVSDYDGYFHLSEVDKGNYKFVISFVGYEKLTIEINVQSKDISLGRLYISPVSEILREVEIIDKVPPVTQKGDTTQYNAESYKVNPDANVEDLVRKMPGITIENGKVHAQGEEVEKVLVDGREFFGEDPTLALRTLPAEVVDKIEVFDKLSDQAEFTGFNDGNTIKTMNIITRMDMRNGQFGRVEAGYGTDDRYSLSGNINHFNDDQRITILGLSNNINKQNFSSQDLLGVMSSSMGRMGGGGRSFGGGGGPGHGSFRGSGINNFMVGQQAGINSTTSLGINYSDEWGENIKVTTSYFFNYSKNITDEDLVRKYISSGESIRNYIEKSESESKNYNHRFNMRFDYKIDSFNSILFTPGINFQDNSQFSEILATNLLSVDELINSTANVNDADYDGYNLSGKLLYRHAFRKKGRTFSINVRSSANDKNNLIYQDALNIYGTTSGQENDTTNQLFDQRSEGLNYGGNITYTEPLGGNSLISLSVHSNYSGSTSDKKTYLEDLAAQEYSILDTALSNEFDNGYLTNRMNLNYRYNKEKLNLTAGISCQRADLNSNQYFPESRKLEKSYDNLLPFVFMRYRFSKTNNLMVFLRSFTNAPSISQLQNVIDNSNPLILYTGNPGLKQEYSNLLVGRYSLTKPKSANMMFLMLHVRKTENYISNNTWIAEKDTLIAEGIVLYRGSQLNRPVNLNGYWNNRIFFVYGFPFEKIKSNINLNTGLSYMRQPGISNNITIITNTYGINQGLVVSSNISEKLDFTFSYNANINFVDNSFEPDANDDYFYQIIRFTISYIFWKGLVLRNNVTYSQYKGLTEVFNQDFLLWNASIGMKLFKNDRGEISLSVFDLLDQNKNINRNVTESYVEDIETRVLQRYLMFSFSYNIRNFKTGKPVFVR